MRRLVFSVFDSKAEIFMQPFFAFTQGVALRSFAGACRDPEHEFSKFPEDFTLFELGAFDDSTGEFDCYPAPQSVVVGAVIKAREVR